MVAPTEHHSICDRRGVAEFLRDRTGATLVEFSLIAFVLVFSIFHVIDLGLTYLTTLQLESATAQVARAIRTRQAQVITQADAKQFVCNRMFLVSSCRTNAIVHVESAATLAAVAKKTVPSDPFSATAAVSFQSGGVDQYVVVAVFVRSSLSVFRGSYQLRALTVVRNEPS